MMSAIPTRPMISSQGERTPQGQVSPLWRMPRSSVMMLRIGTALSMGVSRFTSPMVPLGTGSRVRTSRMMTRLYTGT